MNQQRIVTLVGGVVVALALATVAFPDQVPAGIVLKSWSCCGKAAGPMMPFMWSRPPGRARGLSPNWTMSLPPLALISPCF